MSARVKVQSSGNNWRACWRDSRGSRRYRVIGPKSELSRRQADNLAGQIEIEVTSSAIARDATKAPTLQQWTNDYIRARQHEVAEQTGLLDKDTQRWLLKYFDPTARCDRLTPADADDWRTWLLSEGLTEATVAGHVRRASAMMHRLIRRGQLARNPFDGLPTATPPSDKRADLNESMLVRMLEAAPTQQWRALIGLCAYAGLRRGEALGLTWADIHWNRGRLIAENRKTKRTGGKAIREVRLEPELERILLDVRETAADRELVVGLGNNNLHRTMILIATRAGVPEYPKPFHAWRAWRTDTWKDDYPEHVVDRWLGHSQRVARENYNSVSESYYGKQRDRESELLAEIERLKAHQNHGSATRTTRFWPEPETRCARR